MNLTRLKAVARKEFIHILRDLRSLGLAFGLPIVLISIFGFALSLDVDQVPIMIWDQSRTPASRDLISRFDGSKYFSVSGFVEGYSIIENGLETGDIMAALVIPADFGMKEQAGKTCSAQFLIDGTNANTAAIVKGYAVAIAQAFNQELRIQRLEKKGPVKQTPAAELRGRVWYNDDMESRNNIIPGVIALVLMFLAVILTPMSVAKEWETGTMEMLISTPVKSSELVIGKLIPYILIGFMDIVLAILMGEFVFNVPLRGSVLMLFVCAVLYLITGLALGLCSGILTKNQMAASLITMTVSLLPTMMLSGFLSPIAQMPAFIQGVTWIFPARYFITILKGIYLKGIGFNGISFEISALVLFATGILLFSIKKFQRKLE